MPALDETEPTPLLPLHHFRWDLDKTYLKTEFDTVRDLMKTFVQSADQKRNVPGARTLLKELLRVGGGEAERRLTFISGSPRQMRQVLAQKLELDGVRPDAFILKPNLSNLLKLRFKAIRSQVGYKLTALLQSRVTERPAEEILFGDDAEMDAFIYSLYADLVKRGVTPDSLNRILRASGTAKRHREDILDLYNTVPPDQTKVRRIFINLDQRSPLARFGKFGSRVVPVFNYFQAAVVLYFEGMLPLSSLVAVIEAMGPQGYTPARLANSMQDLMRRGVISDQQIGELEEAFVAFQDHESVSPYLDAFRRAVRAVDPVFPRLKAIRHSLDYLSLARDARFKQNRMRIPLLNWLE
ncbi:MAG: hypothetical protein KC561_02735 [Myxococcales bacterium]|nr:hypothetical protein [Myxococcales bacterium]